MIIYETTALVPLRLRLIVMLVLTRVNVFQFKNPMVPKVHVDRISEHSCRLCKSSILHFCPLKKLLFDQVLITSNPSRGIRLQIESPSETTLRGLLSEGCKVSVMPLLRSMNHHKSKHLYAPGKTCGYPLQEKQQHSLPTVGTPKIPRGTMIM